MVSIQKRKGFFAEFQSLYRTSQGNPKFLVKIFQVKDIVNRFNFKLNQSCSFDKMPGVFFCHCFLQKLVVAFCQVNEPVAHADHD